MGIEKFVSRKCWCIILTLPAVDSEVVKHGTRTKDWFPKRTDSQIPDNFTIETDSRRTLRLVRATSAKLRGFVWTVSGKS